MHSNYLYIIKSLLNKELYSKYRIYIKITKDNPIYILYIYLDKLHEKYDKDLTLEEYVTYVSTETNNESSISELLSILSTSTVSDDLLFDSINLLRKRNLAYELAELSLDVAEGRKDAQSILDFIPKLEESDIKEDSEDFVSIEDALNYDKKPGINWRLKSLNDSLGPLRQGDFGFIFARPESGKTTFLASEVTHFAEQVEKPIIWFNNEEQGSKVLRRCIQGTLGIEEDDINIQTTKKFLEVTKHNLKIKDSASIHRREVEYMIKKYNPSLIIFDQIDKIKGFDGDRNDLKLGSIYQWARELAKSYCPVIGVCQADGTGEGKKWLTMDNVSDSKTAKQAEADFILGIGKSHTEGFEFIRHINISKNKLTGKHDKFDVLIQANIARYKDI